MNTSYDIVAYPTTVHPSTHPERLAVALQLAGLHPVPIERARVLEIGGGSCLGLINFAATYPDSRCYGFDLSATAILNGQRLASGVCPNLTLAVDDIMTAANNFAPQSFDYVIAHGVYAWVPAQVQSALIALIAHVLSPRGVAFVSYNAMPGGHVRMILRNTLLHAISEVEGAPERVAAARKALAAYGAEQAGDDPLMQGLRYHARMMLERPASVVFHDEMGECFAPQALSDVIAAASQVGLRYLTDAGPNRMFDGFLPPDAGDIADPDAEVVKLAQMRDYLELCWFRATLLVPSSAPLSRSLDSSRSAGLWVSAQLEVLDDGEFRSRGEIVKIGDPELASVLRELAAIWPGRLRVEQIAKTPAQLDGLMRLHLAQQIILHAAPAPFVTEPGAFPVAGRLLRAMLQSGEGELVSLANRNLRVDQQELRAMLAAADGTRSVAEIGAMVTSIPSDQIAAALRYAAKQGLLQA